MVKYKCEYVSKSTNKKEISIITDASEVLNIIEIADCDKEIKVFEKKDMWELVYHICDGKRILNELFKKKGPTYAQQNIDSTFEKISKAFEACPSRIENQSFLDIVFDSVFNNEDVSKPKLKVLKNKNSNGLEENDYCK